ncbi:MAG: hypothetical protein OYH77_06675 [Pseudomonadota bacterium]|nr:hypothetical protein [Pseudomonadota bacterium]
MHRGAHEIKRVVKKILGANLDEKKFINDNFSKKITKKVSSPLKIEKLANRLTISKGESFKKPEQIDFTMTFRVRRAGNDFDLWPVAFQAADGRDVNVELYCDDRILVNCTVQNDLIELANTWGKALSAQHVQQSLQQDDNRKNET